MADCIKGVAGWRTAVILRWALRMMSVAESRGRASIDPAAKMSEDEDLAIFVCAKFRLTFRA